MLLETMKESFRTIFKMKSAKIAKIVLPMTINKGEKRVPLRASHSEKVAMNRESSQSRPNRRENARLAVRNRLPTSIAMFLVLNSRAIHAKVFR